MATPTLSIILPVYNAETYVEEAVQSIISQTFTGFELIVVDDGSTDSSMDIVRSFADSRIRILSNDGNRGIVYSRNRGLNHAKGRYIAPFDADDIAHSCKFERQVTFLDSHPAYGMVGSWAWLIDAMGRMLKKRWRLSAPPERIPAILLFRNYFVQSTVVIRREAIPKGGYKEGYDTVEDYLMWTEVARKFRVWNLPEYLVSYRVHEHGVTSKEADLMPDRDARVYAQLFKQLQIDLDKNSLYLLQCLKSGQSNHDLAFLHRMEAFLLQVMAHNRLLAVYDTGQLHRVVLNRWLKACLKTRGSAFRRIHVFLQSPILWK